MDTLKEMRGALGIMYELLIALEKAGFTEETIVEIIKSKGNKLAGEMFNVLPEEVRTKWKNSDLKLNFKVDRDRAKTNFLEMIRSNHDEEVFNRGQRICIENERLSEVTVKIFHFNQNINNTDAIKKMARQGCRPATDYETLTFCELNPDWAKEHQVCALGTLYSLRGTCYTKFYDVNGLTVSCHFKNSNPPSTRFLGIF